MGGEAQSCIEPTAQGGVARFYLNSGPKGGFCIISSARRNLFYQNNFVSILYQMHFVANQLPGGGSSRVLRQFSWRGKVLRNSIKSAPEGVVIFCINSTTEGG